MITSVVVLRIIWGFCGSGYARFSQFVTSPIRAIGYLIDLLRSHAKRYLGHSPAGAWMTLFLMVSLLGNVSTGMVLYALEDHAGPLAFLVDEEPTEATDENMNSMADQLVDADMHHNEDSAKERVEEIHEFLANITLFLMIMHVAGVLLGSHRHRENLIKAMITGKKRI